MRLLIWLLLGLIVFLAVRSRVRNMQDNLRQAVREEMARNQGNSPQRNPQTAAENMVACAYCNVYLPMSEAVQLVTPSSTRYFCSEDHLRADAGKLSSSDHSAPHE